MALTTETDALTQLNANLNWEDSLSAATLALEAVRWLMFNRPQGVTVNGRSLTYTMLESTAKEIAARVKALSSSRTNFVRAILGDL